jgi:DNA polymerase-3 subunit delta'
MFWMKRAARSGNKYFYAMNISWPHTAGQQRVKEVLGAALANNTMGHAYLLSGREGSGTFAAALDVALLLLCSDAARRPCLTCASCRKTLHYAHPDFHVIMPVVLGKEHKSDGGELKPEGWEYIGSCVKERLSDPYCMPDHAKVPNLPVDWVREVNQTVLRGSAQSGPNVVIIDGIDAMNAEAANSMLKILEEPPPGTVMLLLTGRLSAVLPTVVSRCQILRFSFLSPREIRDELCRRHSIDPTDVRLENVVHAGTLGEALDLWRHPPDETVQEAVRFWDLCMQGDWEGLGVFIDQVAQWADFSRYERMFVEIMERVRNAFLSELPGTENVFSGQQSRIVRFDGAFTMPRFDAAITYCQQAIDAIRAHASITLVLAHFAIALTKEFHGKECKTG